LLDSLSGLCISGSVAQDINVLDGSLIFTFNNCDLGSNKTLNGNAIVSGDLTGSSSVAFTNFTIKNNTGSITSSIENLTASCPAGTTGSCNVSSDFTGTDGLIYRVSNFTITADINGDFAISGRLYHPDYGYIDITTSTNISFGTCTSTSIPDTGIVQFTGTNSATVTYTCTNITTSITGGATTTATW